MNEEQWISKKELLALTGISYGQLYRWKREKLIPDNWFMKTSASTGQETFLPRERVLERIRFIQEKRDTWPLNRMQELLNPSTEGKSYRQEELAAFPASAAEIALQRELCGEETLTHAQTVCAILASKVRREAALPEDTATQLLAAINRWEADGLIARGGGSLTVYRVGEVLLPILSEAESAPHAPEGTDQLAHIRLDDAVPQITTALSAFH